MTFDLEAVDDRFYGFIRPTNLGGIFTPLAVPEDYEWDREKCWYWDGSTNNGGYGRFRVDSRTWLAHRYAYWRWRGAIEEGMQIDHLCFHRSCVNPEHLEKVTAGENTRRSRAFPRDRRQAWPAFRSAASKRAQERALSSAGATA